MNTVMRLTLYKSYRKIKLQKKSIYGARERERERERERWRKNFSKWAGEILSLYANFIGLSLWGRARPLTGKKWGQRASPRPMVGLWCVCPASCSAVISFLSDPSVVMAWHGMAQDSAALNGCLHALPVNDIVMARGERGLARITSSSHWQRRTAANSGVACAKGTLRIDRNTSGLPNQKSTSFCLKNIQ